MTNKENFVVIKFPAPADDDVKKTLGMTEEELDDAISLTGSDPDDIVSTYLNKIDRIEKKQSPSLLKNHLKEIRSDITKEKNFISSFNKKKDDIKFFEFLSEFQFILTTAFVILTLAINTYSSFQLFKNDTLPFLILIFTALQLSIVTVQDNINSISNRLEEKTNLIIGIYIRFYACYSAFNLFNIIYLISEYSDGKMNTQMESILQQSFIIMFVFMTAMISLISMNILCDGNKKNGKKNINSTPNKYGSSGYH